MPKLAALTRQEAPAENQPVFDQLKQAIGMVPNLYATYAHSPVALKALLQFDETLKGGSFTNREVEAIALAIAEANACEYCLAAHTAIGKMNGFTEEQTIELRTLSSSDEKLLALTSLVQSITITRGRPEETLIEAFYSAGYDKAALVELLGFVAVNTYNNYLNNIAGTVVDFPAAPALATV